MAQTAVKNPCLADMGLSISGMTNTLSARKENCRLSSASIQPEYTHRLLQHLGLILQ